MQSLCYAPFLQGKQGMAHQSKAPAGKGVKDQRGRRALAQLGVQSDETDANPSQEPYLPLQTNRPNGNGYRVRSIEAIRKGGKTFRKNNLVPQRTKEEV